MPSRMSLFNVSVPVQVAPFAMPLLGTSPVLPAVALADGVGAAVEVALADALSAPCVEACTSCEPVASAATSTSAPAPMTLSRTRRRR